MKVFEIDLSATVIKVPDQRIQHPPKMGLKCLFKMTLGENYNPYQAHRSHHVYCG